MSPRPRLIAIDFDGVLHSYTTPWTDAPTISDRPTPGAMPFLKALAADLRFEAIVVSSRCSCPLAVERIETWLQNHLISAFGEHEGFDIYASGLRVMRSDEGKLPAHITLDDRGWRFEGKWPDLDELAAFVPWNKRSADLKTEIARIDEGYISVEEAKSRFGVEACLDAKLVDEIRTRLMGVDPDSQDIVLDDDDWQRILGWARRPKAVPVYDAALKPPVDLETMFRTVAEKALYAGVWHGGGDAMTDEEIKTDIDSILRKVLGHVPAAKEEAVEASIQQVADDAGKWNALPEAFREAVEVVAYYHLPAEGVRVLDIPDAELRRSLVDHVQRHDAEIEIDHLWVYERNGECRFGGGPLKFSVLVETTPSGEPGTWPEGADKPQVVASGLSYAEAHRERTVVEEGMDDREDYCDCDPADCRCSRTTYSVYVEEDAG